MDGGWLRWWWQINERKKNLVEEGQRSTKEVVGDWNVMLQWRYVFVGLWWKKEFRKIENSHQTVLTLSQSIQKLLPTLIFQGKLPVYVLQIFFSCNVYFYVRCYETLISLKNHWKKHCYNKIRNVFGKSLKFKHTYTNFFNAYFSNCYIMHCTNYFRVSKIFSKQKTKT